MRLHLNMLTVFIFLLSGCDSSSSSIGSNTPNSEESLILIGSEAGESRLGALYSLDMKDISQKTRLYQTPGGHEPYTNERYFNGGMVWNPVDGRFWGVTPSHFPGAGKLVSFDPEADKLTYEVNLSEEHIAGSDFYASSWKTMPIISPDGKGMIIVAQNGGRESLLSSIPGAGDGVVVHINIDKEDASKFGEMSIVYEIYSGGNGGVGEFRNVLNNPVLGRYPNNSGKSAVLFLSAGEKWADTSQNPIQYFEKNAQAFILTPSNDNDWSEPWTVANQYDLINGSQYALNQISTNAFYDQTVTRSDGHGAGRFVWSTRDYIGGDIYISSDDRSYLPNIISDVNSECFFNGGLYHVGQRYYQLCTGFDRDKTDTYYNNVPRLLEINSTGSATSVMAFSNWKNLGGSQFHNLAPIEVSVDRDSSSILVNAATLWGGEMLRGSLVSIKDISFYPSRIEEIKPFSGERSILFEGNSEYGKHFVGKPSLGGDNNEYVVQYSISDSDQVPGYLLKYNRISREVSKFRLGAKGPAYFASEPLIAENSILFSSMLRTKEKGIGFVRMNKNDFSYSEHGFGGQINSHNEAVYAGVPLNFTRLENGDIWAVTKDVSKGKNDVFVNFDTNTFSVTSKSYLSDIIVTGVEPLNFIDGIYTTFTSESKGNVLIYPAISVIDHAPHVSINCTPQPGNPNVVQSYVLPEYKIAQKGPTVVKGPTLFSDGSLYVATKGGLDSILKIEMGNCSASPVVTTLVPDLTTFGSLPSTRFLSASNEKLYFGTSDGHLASFDPKNNNLVKVIDLSDNDTKTNSRVVGYISEPEEGYIYGVVADTLISNDNPISRRIFKYDVKANNLVGFVDASDIFDDADLYPGVSKMN